MRLNELKPGEYGIITAVDGSGIVRDRLLDMGLTPKTELFLRKTAPMGDPIEITLRGYELTIRKDDAKMIVIDLCANRNQFGNICTESCKDCMKHMGDEIKEK